MPNQFLPFDHNDDTDADADDNHDYHHAHVHQDDSKVHLPSLQSPTNLYSLCRVRQASCLLALLDT